MAKMDVQFFKPFVDGTLETLKVQCRIKASPAKPFYKGKVEQPDFDIAAVIGLSSKVFKGSISLCFSESLFLYLMSSMLGEDFDTITEDLEDGAAELLNIIFGQAKRVLNEEGYDIEKAIPTVVRGSGLKTKHLSNNPTIVLPFTTEKGEIHIEISTEADSM